MAGIGYETAFEHIDRPWLLGVFVAMMGLPGAILTVRPRDNSLPPPPGADGTDSSPPTSPPPS
jgi:hypothetical protein